MPFFALWANPLVRKATLYVGIAVVALMLIRYYSNSIAEQAERKGEARGEEKQLQLQETLWKGRLEILTKMQVDLDRDSTAAAQNRAAIKNDLAKGVNSINTQLAGIKGRVDQLKPSDYDRRIKELLEETR